MYARVVWYQVYIRLLIPLLRFISRASSWFSVVCVCECMSVCACVCVCVLLYRCLCSWLLWIYKNTHTLHFISLLLLFLSLILLLLFCYCMTCACVMYVRLLTVKSVFCIFTSIFTYVFKQLVQRTHSSFNCHQLLFKKNISSTKI